LASGSIEGTNLPIEDWLERSAGLSKEDLLQEMSFEFLGARLPAPIASDLTTVIDEIGDLKTEHKVRAVLAGLIASPAFQYR
jgi:hypothetical protein